MGSYCCNKTIYVVYFKKTILIVMALQLQCFTSQLKQSLFQEFVGLFINTNRILT